MLSDAELVRAAKGGDAASLGILLERYRAPLYAQALRILGHGPEAQDAVQEAFIIALRKIDQLRESEAVGGWLRAILRNVCLMWLRTQGEVLLDEPPTGFAQEPSEPLAEEAIDRLALREWVWSALGELPEDLQATAMLRYFGSYSSYEQISAILGVPIGTVRSRLNRAKVQLADALLKTAELAHDEARRITESQTRFFEAAFDELDGKGDSEMWASAFSDDLLWTVSGGAGDYAGHRRASWVRLFEKDLEDGVKVPIANVLASKDVTMIEADQVNPPEDPFHCPPAISMVGFYRDGLIQRMRAYDAPRSKRKGGESARISRQIFCPRFGQPTRRKARTRA